MKIEITEEEIHEMAKAITIAANSELHDAIDWEIMAKFLAKIDRNPPPALPLDRPNLNRL